MQNNKITPQQIAIIGPEWDKMQAFLAAPKAPVLNSVLVMFEDPQYNYHTSVSPISSEQSCREYFVGARFNVQPYPSEFTAECIDIVFTDNNKSHE